MILEVFSNPSDSMILPFPHPDEGQLKKVFFSFLKVKKLLMTVSLIENTTSYILIS